MRMRCGAVAYEVRLWESTVWAKARAPRDVMYLTWVISRLFLPSAIRSAALHVGVRELSVTAARALAVAELPHLHRDSCDRMLIAQALSEPVRLMTADSQIQLYEAASGVLMAMASARERYSANSVWPRNRRIRCNSASSAPRNSAPRGATPLTKPTSAPSSPSRVDRFPHPMTWSRQSSGNA